MEHPPYFRVRLSKFFLMSGLPIESPATCAPRPGGYLISGPTGSGYRAGRFLAKSRNSKQKAQCTKKVANLSLGRSFGARSYAHRDGSDGEPRPTYAGAKQRCQSASKFCTPNDTSPEEAPALSVARFAWSLVWGQRDEAARFHYAPWRRSGTAAGGASRAHAAASKPRASSSPAIRLRAWNMRVFTVFCG